MGKGLRGLAVALVPLLVCMTAGTALAQTPASFEALQAAAQAERDYAYVAEMLETMSQAEPMRRTDMRLSDWLIRAGAFALRVPDGYAATVTNRGANILLQDESIKNAPQATNIMITIAREVDGLDKLTAEQVRKAYPSAFQRFELVAFSRETLFDEECVRIWFTCGQAPQLLVEQCMFNKNGQGYYITLTMEYELGCVERGLNQYATFRDSVMFATPSETRPE